MPSGLSRLPADKLQPNSNLIMREILHLYQEQYPDFRVSKLNTAQADVLVS